MKEHFKFEKVKMYLKKYNVVSGMVFSFVLIFILFFSYEYSRLSLYSNENTIKICSDVDETLTIIFDKSSKRIESFQKEEEQTGYRSFAICRNKLDRYLESSYKNEYCKNMEDYITHTYHRAILKKDINILYKYMIFINRIQNDNMKYIDNKSDKSITDTYMSIEFINSLYKPYFIGKPYDLLHIYMIDRMFKSGYQGIEKNISYKSPEFIRWFELIKLREYESADEIIDNYEIQGIKSNINKICKGM